MLFQLSSISKRKSYFGHENEMKKWWFSWVQPSGPFGSNWHWPVILPLHRVGGCRCSVKPASRIALIFRNHWTQSLSSSTLAHLFAWNRQARLKASLKSDQLVWTKVPSHYAPTWVTSSHQYITELGTIA